MEKVLYCLNTDTLRQYGHTVCSKQNPKSHFKGLQMGIFGFWQKESGAKSVAMATAQWCHVVAFVMYISGGLPSN